MARTKTKPIPAPQSRDDCNGWIYQLGMRQRALDELKTRMNDELASIKAAYENEATPIRKDVETLTSGIAVFCGANRDALTNGKSKTIKFAAGEVSWRQRPPRVNLRGITAILERLRAMGLTQFIRTKQEIDKEAILADPDVAVAVEGISVGTAGEELIVKPFELELEEVAK